VLGESDGGEERRSGKTEVTHVRRAALITQSSSSPTASRPSRQLILPAVRVRRPQARIYRPRKGMREGKEQKGL
jgi:hypothetical protein